MAKNAYMLSTQSYRTYVVVFDELKNEKDYEDKTEGDKNNGYKSDGDKPILSNISVLDNIKIKTSMSFYSYKKS